MHSVFQAAKQIGAKYVVLTSAKTGYGVNEKPDSPTGIPPPPCTFNVPDDCEGMYLQYVIRDMLEPEPAPAPPKPAPAPEPYTDPPPAPVKQKGKGCCVVQ